MLRPDMRAGSVIEVGIAFLKLGVISFGGPMAHLGYFHGEFVRRRRWLGDEAYADLVALCQFLPGPASSQVAFALGMRRAGLAGALVASLCFMMPSALLMIAFAYGVTSGRAVASAGWVHGLKLAAVAVVAQAVWSMGRKLCPDPPRLSIAALAAAFLLVEPRAWAQVGVIAVGALVGWILFRTMVHPPSADHHAAVGGHKGAIAALVLFALLLFGAPLLARVTEWRSLALFDAFYRSGSLVFGGGHVVLPLLRAELVPNGWISDDAFLAGYGAVQAVPGPLFTFAAYLGTVIEGGHRAWLGGLWALLAIFLPAWLLVAGVLPFWHRLRAKRWAQAALCGANAAVVGVLLAALITPVITDGVRDGRDAVTAMIAFGLLMFGRLPPWAVVALCAIAGQWLLGT